MFCRGKNIDVNTLTIRLAPPSAAWKAERMFHDRRMWLAAGPTARRDDALIRRKQPNLTNHVRGLHPAFDRQYDSATFMKKFGCFLGAWFTYAFLATWQIIGFQATAYDAGTNCGIFLVRPKWPKPN